MTPNVPDGPGVGRRRAMATMAGIVAGLAGCASTGGTDTPATATPTGGGERTDAGRAGTATTATDTPAGETASSSPVTETAASPTPASEPDLREANVVGVAFEPEDGGYRFDVTLYHDDDGEDGYANWWQVETLDGDRLGRRELLHAHGTREFTRSATVDVPDGVTCVVVRGHDQTHGYGGDVALVNLDSGATKQVRQGPEPRQFEASDCP